MTLYGACFSSSHLDRNLAFRTRSSVIVVRFEVFLDGVLIVLEEMSIAYYAEQ